MVWEKEKKRRKSTLSGGDSMLEEGWEEAGKGMGCRPCTCLHMQDQPHLDPNNIQIVLINQC
jgi:hypothetical protein